VRDPVAGEDLGRPVVHADGNGDLHAFLAPGEDVDEVVVDVEDGGHPTELLTGDLERILAEVGGRGFDRRHERISFFSANAAV
jgi:hypothetical protein